MAGPCRRVVLPGGEARTSTRGERASRARRIPGFTDVPDRPSTFKLLAAFAAIYLIWGSTYLGIKVAIEAMPPFFMAGSRFALAGLLLMAWLALRGRVAVTDLSGPRVAVAAVVGILMLGGGNGLVVWAIERGAPTGLVAVLIAITPFWLVGIERLVEPSRRITRRIVVGLAVGVVGIVVLSGIVEPSGPAQAPVAPTVLLMMLLATLSWACGSMLSRYGSRRAPGQVDPLLAPALQMIAGGAALLAYSGSTERWGSIDLGEVTVRAWIGYAYLVLLGSIVAYSAFIWLLRKVSAAMVGTYAYVNPVVAVVLGSLVLGETLTVRTGVASGLILVAVALITWPVRPSPAPPSSPGIAPPGEEPPSQESVGGAT